MLEDLEFISLKTPSLLPVAVSDPDDCAGIVCYHGTCVDDVNTWRCDCDAGYEGALCEMSTFMAEKNLICLFYLSNIMQPIVIQ